MARSLLPSPPMVRARALHARRGPPGFTLVELAIVVVIVGILATLAVVGYRRLVTSSHMSEATHMINAIRTAQEAYHAETQTYWTDPGNCIGPPGSGCLYPPQNDPPGAIKTGWGGPPVAWQTLPVHADGAVMYGYGTISGTAGSNPPATTPGVNGQPTNLSFPATSPTDWYVVSAYGDPDGNGVFSAAFGTSWTNDVFTYFEGE